VDTAYARAHKVLTEGLDKLHALAQGLLEYETLSGDEIRQLLRGEPIIRDTDSDEPGAKTREPPRRSSIPTSGVTGQPGFGSGPEPLPGS
jgi:cell division protease FtsH